MSTTTADLGTSETCTSAIPDAWTMSFDLTDEEHCYGAVTDRIADLDETVRAALTTHLPDDLDTVDYYDLRRALEAATEATNDALATAQGPAEDTLDALIEKLEDATYDLREHGDCQCALDAWQSVESNFFDTAIAESVDGPRSWATFDSGDTPKAVFTRDAPTVSELWKSLNKRDGWSSVNLEWIPAERQLDFSFGSYPSMWHGYAIALTPEQMNLAERFEELDSYQDLVECFVVKANASIVELVINLWGNNDDTTSELYSTFDGDPQRAVAELTARLAGADPVELATLVALSRTWTASLDELLETAQTVAA